VNYYWKKDLFFLVKNLCLRTLLAYKKGWWTFFSTRKEKEQPRDERKKKKEFCMGAFALHKTKKGKERERERWGGGGARRFVFFFFGGRRRALLYWKRRREEARVPGFWAGAGVAVSAAFELLGGRPNKYDENEILWANVFGKQHSRQHRIVVEISIIIARGRPPMVMRVQNEAFVVVGQSLKILWREMRRVEDSKPQLARCNLLHQTRTKY
jgi:hypothetical protein